MLNELKPCKCGSRVWISYSNRLWGIFLWYTIVCVDCQKTKVRARTIEKAKEKWNRRANDEQAD